MYSRGSEDGDPVRLVGVFGFTVTGFCLAIVSDMVLVRLRGWRIARLKPRHPDAPWRRFSQWRASSLELARFPFFLGESLEVDLKLAGRGERLVTLRLVDESYKGVFQVYAEWRRVQVADGKFRLEFALPADASPNHPTELPYKYWEIEVAGPGRERGPVFLLPVYASGGR